MQRRFAELLEEFYALGPSDMPKQLRWLEKQSRLPHSLPRWYHETEIDEGLFDVPSVRRVSRGNGCFSGWTVVRVLGEGRYGRVYEVRDKDGVAYALKRISLSGLTRWYIPRLRNEIELGKKMGQEGVGPKILDAFQCGQSLFIVQELLRGEPLYDWVQNHPLTERQKGQIERLADKMHRLGVIHNDLHSDNIFVVPPPKSKASRVGPRFYILDFGFSLTRTRPEVREKEELRELLYELSLPHSSVARKWAYHRLQMEQEVMDPIP
jgi:serine/threonine protein kinase